MGDRDAEADVAALAEEARSQHVVVIGGGIAGIVAALECAKVGLRVTLVEASARLGGAIRTIEAAGLTLDAAVEGWPLGNSAMRGLTAELGLTDSVVPADDAATWIAGIPGGAAPMPRATIAGIPANPWDEGVRRIIGWRGTWRAYLDRLRPPLTIGKERSLGTLVRSRMGELVLDRLVAPPSLGLYGVHPDEVDVEAVAPGLSTALTRTGSLSGAVADLLVDRSPGPMLEGIDGGMSRLVSAVESRFGSLGVDVRTSTRVQRLERSETGQLVVGARQDDASSRLDPADEVVLAVPEAEARHLLAPLVPALDRVVRARPQWEVVTLVVGDSGHGEARRGAVFPLEGTHRAVALTDSTLRWPWLAAEAGEMRVLRVVFGGAGGAAATADLDDRAAFELARAEASALLDVALDDVRGAARARFDPPTPASSLGHAEASAAARAAIRGVPGVAAVGAWLAGSGLAQVVADAVDEAERVRRSAIFGRSIE